MYFHPEADADGISHKNFAPQFGLRFFIGLDGAHVRCECQLWVGCGPTGGDQRNNVSMLLSHLDSFWRASSKPLFQLGPSSAQLNFGANELKPKWDNSPMFPVRESNRAITPRSMA
jgi:hypothetical protein